MAEEKLELQMDMDPVERLTKEIEFTKIESAKRVGQFLLEQFKKDVVLRECYRDRKVALNNLWGYIVNQARKVADGQGSCAIDDETVYGWAIHFVQDGEIKEPATEKLVVTRTVITEEEKEQAKAKALEEFKNQEVKRLEEERQKQEEKEKAKRKAALEKEKKKREESGQISLFDDWGDDDA